MRKLIDFTGKTFNRWTVIRFAGVQENKRMWECKCNCGNIHTYPTSGLGKTVSCGCFQKETIIRIMNAKPKIGKRPPEYHVWKSMINRCTNTSSDKYKDYGGRGIMVCGRWLNSFDNFISDMGRRPSSLYSIDRFPNNDGDYEPHNCRWATMKEQANNRRSNILIILNGNTNTLQQIIDSVGMNKQTFKSRLYLGWSIEDIIDRPIKHKKISTP